MYKENKNTKINFDHDCKIPTKKKASLSKVTALTLILVLMLGLVLPVFAETINNVSSPKVLLTLAYLKNYKKLGFDANFDMNIEAISSDKSDEATKVLDLLNNFSAYGNVKANFKSEESFKVSEYLVYKYSDEELVTLDLYADESKLIMDIPTFLDSSIFVSYNEMIKTMLAESNPDIKFSLKDYYPLLTKKDIPEYDLLSLEYGKLLIDRIEPFIKSGKNKTIKTTGINATTYDCDEITLTFSIEEYYSIYFEVLNKLIDDPRVESIIKTKFDAAIEISKENGLLTQMGMTEEDIEAINNDFSTTYALFIAAMKEELNYDKIMEELKESSSLDGDITFVFYIDQDQNIRSIQENMVLPLTTTSLDSDYDITLKVDLNMVYNNYDDVKVGMPSLNKAYNLTRDTQAAIDAIVVDATEHIATYLEDRPKINDLINELNK